MMGDPVKSPHFLNFVLQTSTYSPLESPILDHPLPGAFFIYALISMANKRMISRGLGKSRKVLEVFESGNSLAEFSMVLYCMGIPHHDEKGLLSADPHDWKYDICPLSKRPIEDFREALKILMTAKLLKLSPCGKALKYVNHENVQSYKYGKGRPISTYFPDIKEY